MNDEFNIQKVEENKLEKQVKDNSDYCENFSLREENFKKCVENCSNQHEKIISKTNLIEEINKKRELALENYENAQKKYLDYKILLKEDFDIMEKIKTNLLGIDKEIHLISNDIKQKEEYFPNLEKEKKNMVSTRNFKVFKFYNYIVLNIFINSKKYELASFKY